MNTTFPIHYSLSDGTKIEVTKTDETHISFTLDKPTGHTDSFTWALQQEEQQQPEDPQQQEALDMFIEMNSF